VTTHLPERLAFALIATLAAAGSPAEEAAVTRDTYDAFMAAYIMEQHRAACERYAPGVYEEFAEQVASWRIANEAAMRRLASAARAWQLPGNRSVDELLAHIAVSMDDDYATMGQGAVDAQCQQLLGRLRL
jgi:hypothetical protein